MLIGLSVSGCIRDICTGEVDINDVVYIIGGIDPGEKDENLYDILERYDNTYWRDLPSARKVFGILYNNGRIICPRKGQQPENSNPLLLIANGCWLDANQINRIEDRLSTSQPTWMDSVQDVVNDVVQETIDEIV